MEFLTHAEFMDEDKDEVFRIISELYFDPKKKKGYL
jgi:hypothetical protein